MIRKLLIILTMCLLLVGTTLALTNTIFVNEDHMGNNITNVSYVNADYFVGDGSGITGVSVTLTNSSVNSSQMYVDGSDVLQIIGSWFNNIFYYQNETYASGEIDTAIQTANSSMKTYVDTENTNQNTSLVNYVGVVNSSMTSYVDNQDVAANTSLKNYADNTFYTLANIYGFYNSSDFNIGDYYLLSNPYGFYNSTDFSISNYVPYSGATGAVDIGANGFSAATVNTGQGDNELYAMNQDVESTDAVTFANTTVRGGATSELIVQSTTDSQYKQTFRIVQGAGLYWLWGTEADEDQYMSVGLGGGQNRFGMTTRDFNLYGTSDADPLLFVKASDNSGDTEIKGTLDAPTLNTGQGDNELYDMDQNVLTTSDVTFNSVNSDVTGDLTGNADTASDSTAWITMTSLQSKWLADVGNVLTFDEAELNSTIDARASGGASFDQDLNTTSDVTFNDQNLTGIANVYGVNGDVVSSITSATCGPGCDQGYWTLYANGASFVTIKTAEVSNFPGGLNTTTLNTGQGDNELYAMNQDVRTTSDVTFDSMTITSGQKICLDGATCSHYIVYNGTHTVTT